MNKDEQTKEYGDIFTFQEKDSKNFKINDVKRKDNFEFMMFSYRETILEISILYIRN